MSPEAHLLRLAYIDINALLVEGFDTNAQDLVDAYRTSVGIKGPKNIEEIKLFPYEEPLLGVAQTLIEIRDLFGADNI